MFSQSHRSPGFYLSRLKCYPSTHPNRKGINNNISALPELGLPGRNESTPTRALGLVKLSWADLNTIPKAEEIYL